MYSSAPSENSSSSHGSVVAFRPTPTKPALTTGASGFSAFTASYPDFRCSK